MEAKMLLENLVIKYKTDEKINTVIIAIFYDKLHLHTNKSIEGKNDPLELMTPSKINIVH
jgi:hypothetical protein